MNNGIYEIRCLENGKCYIDKTLDTDGVWLESIMELNDNKHKNINLQIEWNVYGAHRFQFNILRNCTYDTLELFKEYYIDVFKSIENGYNNKSDIKNISSFRHNLEELEMIQISYNRHNVETAYIINKLIECYGEKDKLTEDIRSNLVSYEGAILYIDEIRTDVAYEIDKLIKEKVAKLCHIEEYLIEINRNQCTNQIVNFLNYGFIEVNLTYREKATKRLKVYINDSEDNNDNIDVFS